MTLKNPILITGLRKSGTSMVKRLIDDHPEIFVYPPNELHLFRHTSYVSLITSKSFVGVKLRRNLCEDVLAVRDELKSDTFINIMLNKGVTDYSPKFNPTKMLDILGKSNPASYKELLENILEAARAATDTEQARNTDRIAWKAVLEEEFFPEYVSWFPGIKVVYVMRNPYAHLYAARQAMRAGRLKSQGKYPRGIPGSDLPVENTPFPYLGPAIRRMHLSYAFAEKFNRIYPDKFYILVYDRLIQNPEKELELLCEFLGVNYSDSLLYTTCCGDPVSGASHTTGRHDNRISQNPGNAWMKRITPLETALINRYFQWVIKLYGFSVFNGKSVWKRNRKESFKTYFANRWLLTPSAKNFLVA